MHVDKWLTQENFFQQATTAKNRQQQPTIDRNRQKQPIVGNSRQQQAKIGNKNMQQLATVVKRCPTDALLMHVTCQFCPSANKFFPTHLIDSAVQERTSLRDIFFLKSPFFWMLRLLAAKFSRSVRVPADSVEWMLAETERVEPENNQILKYQNLPENRKTIKF